MYGTENRINALHGFAAIYTHSFDEVFHDCFAYMWLNFIDTALDFLLQDVDCRGFVGINFRLKKTQKKQPMALNRMFWVANSDHHVGTKK